MDRLYSKVALRLSFLYLSNREDEEAEKIGTDLFKSCFDEENKEISSKGSILVESTSLLIQIYYRTNQFSKLKEKLNTLNTLGNNIFLPRIIAPVKEIAGMISLNERKFDDARGNFFDAYKYFNQINDERQINCFRYTLLSCILSNTMINPTSSAGAYSLQEDKQVSILSQLLDAYQRREIKKFNDIINNKEQMEILYKDDVIKKYFDEITEGMRRNKIIQMVASYSDIKLSYLSKELGCTQRDAELLCAMLISDGKIKGKIDQIKGLLVLEAKNVKAEKYAAIEGMREQIDKFIQKRN